VEVVPSHTVAVVVDQPDVVHGVPPSSLSRPVAAEHILPSVDTASLARVVESRRDAFVELLRDLVDIDSGTYSPQGVNRVADHLEGRFMGAGWHADRRAHTPGQGAKQLGDVLVATVKGSGAHRVLLVCHMDTVWPDGTAAARPFRIDGDRGYGPGSS